MSAEPLPCPFCGKTPGISRYESRSFGTSFQVECDNPFCDIRPSTNALFTEATAIQQWNERKKFS